MTDALAEIRNADLPFTLTKYALDKQFRKLCKYYGIEDAHFHDLRHQALTNFMKDKGIEKKNILYMGDDNPDIKPLKVVGISSCPKDASVDVKSICDYVSHKKGGYGCVRDVIEQVMRIHDKWI